MLANENFYSISFVETLEAEMALLAGQQWSTTGGLNYFPNHNVGFKLQVQNVRVVEGAGRFSWDLSRPVNVYGASITWCSRP
jgi:hypothetical protein